jgi:hypothetical protein
VVAAVGVVGPAVDDVPGALDTVVGSGTSSGPEPQPHNASQTLTITPPLPERTTARGW